MSDNIDDLLASNFVGNSQKRPDSLINHQDSSSKKIKLEVNINESNLFDNITKDQTADKSDDEDSDLDKELEKVLQQDIGNNNHHQSNIQKSIHSPHHNIGDDEVSDNVANDADDADEEDDDEDDGAGDRDSANDGANDGTNDDDGNDHDDHRVNDNERHLQQNHNTNQFNSKENQFNHHNTTQFNQQHQQNQFNDQDTNQFSQTNQENHYNQHDNQFDQLNQTNSSNFNQYNHANNQFNQENNQSESSNFAEHLNLSSNSNYPDERENLALIANQLAAATESNKLDKPDKPVRTILHDGIHIPEDSELLNTNAAVAAYNALSSQLPSFLGANAHLAALPLPIVAEDYLPPRIQLLINTLPTLDNLATQLLRIVAIGPYQKIIDIASNPDTPAGATYRDLSSLFEFTRRLYSEDIPFLTVEHIAPGLWKEGDLTPSMFKSREQSIESTLRKVNLATFLSATLGTIDAGFFYLNESFMDIFCPNNNLDPNNSLSNIGPNSMSLQSGVNTVIGEKVGKILKPQAELYLDLKTQAYISALEAGDRTKLENLNDLLPDNLEEYLLQRRGVKTLSPTELDFVERCKARKETLLAYPDDKDLSQEYEWFQFVKDLFDYVGKNMGFIIYGKKGRTQINKKEFDMNTPHSQEIINHYKELRMNPPQTPTITQPITNETFNDLTNSLLPSEIQEQQIHIKLNPRANSNKNLQRRPWTREEEKALRHALELKGPQWSTILELFGNGGKISESLKNRTQVQLKDKARNWKMFFLKNGLPIPSYLQRVTGDLDRQDRSKSTRKAIRNKKTAAAPVPRV